MLVCYRKTFRYRLRREAVCRSRSAMLASELWCGTVLTADQRCCCRVQHKTDAASALSPAIVTFLIHCGRQEAPLPLQELCFTSHSHSSSLCELERGCSSDLGHREGRSSFLKKKTINGLAVKRAICDFPQLTFGFWFTSNLTIKFRKFNLFRLSLDLLQKLHWRKSFFIPSYKVFTFERTEWAGHRITEHSRTAVKLQW